VVEYGTAISVAIGHFLAGAQNENVALDQASICQRLAQAHAQLGSDWDDDVWDLVPELTGLKHFSSLKTRANTMRRECSRVLTQTGMYANVLAVLTSLKSESARLYLATEATESAAANAITWLGLEDMLDGVYAWPSTKPHARSRHAHIFPFPPDPAFPAQFVQKPHPLVLGTILLDEAKRRGSVPSHVTTGEVFAFLTDDQLDLRSLERRLAQSTASSAHKLQARAALRAMRTRLQVKNSAYAAAIHEIKRDCFYVGDSLFKDGLLAKNADIPFVHAQYGSRITDDAKATYGKAKDLLLHVTGWNGTIMELTQESRHPLGLGVEPALVCRENLHELLAARAVDLRSRSRGENFA